jgi:hypothetical protein
MSREIITEVPMFQVGQVVRVTKVLRKGIPSRNFEPGTFEVSSVRYDSTYGFVYNLTARSSECAVQVDYLRMCSSRHMDGVSQRYVRA